MRLVGLLLASALVASAAPSSGEGSLLPVQGKPPAAAPTPPAAVPTPPAATPTPPAAPRSGAPPASSQRPAQPPAAPQARPAAPSEEVRSVQNLLRIIGIETGTPDGLMSDRTRDAIREFQGRYNLTTDGQISAALIARLAEAVAATRGQGGKPMGALRLGSTGTGFAINRQGHLLTNNHVVATCAQVRVRPAGQEPITVAVVTRDTGNDLALLRLPSEPPATVRFRDGRSVRAGESVVVVGYPLRGLLAAEATVTSGEVSALAGLRNDNRHMTISAPVQPGNSGGPLLDQSGNVIGVIVAKLNAQQVAQVTGDIPQNVNFAIKSSVARNFLEANGIEYELSTSSEPVSTADIADRARRFTYVIECMR